MPRRADVLLRGGRVPDLLLRTGRTRRAASRGRAVSGSPGGCGLRSSAPRAAWPCSCCRRSDRSRSTRRASRPTAETGRASRSTGARRRSPLPFRTKSTSACLPSSLSGSSPLVLTITASNCERYEAVIIDRSIVSGSCLYTLERRDAEAAGLPQLRHRFLDVVEAGVLVEGVVRQEQQSLPRRRLRDGSRGCLRPRDGSDERHHGRQARTGQHRTAARHQGFSKHPHACILTSWYRVPSIGLVSRPRDTSRRPARRCKATTLVRPECHIF